MVLLVPNFCNKKITTQVSVDLDCLFHDTIYKKISYDLGRVGKYCEEIQNSKRENYEVEKKTVMDM